MRSNRYLFCCLVSFCLSILTSCKMPGRARKAPEDTLRLAFGSDPLVIDPQLAETGLAVFLAQQLTSTLLIVDPQLQLKTQDAESYVWNSSGTILSFKLKTGLKWSDASPLNACQYKDGIIRALDPSIPSPYADLFYEIRGAKSFKLGKAQASEVGILCSAEKNELSFELMTPFSVKTLYALAFVASAPIRKEFCPSGELSQNNLIPHNSHPGISNGSYFLKEWKRDQKIRLEKNSHSPEYNLAKIKYVEIPIVRDNNISFTMFESGELDVLDEIPTSQIANVLKREEFQSSPWLTTYMMGFSFKGNSPLKNLSLRKALTQVAHQEEVPLLLKSGEEAAKSWVPSALIPPEHRSSKSLFDPESAKLDFQKIPKTLFKKDLELYFNGGERHKMLMERFAYNVFETLGIKIQLHSIEWKVLLSQLKHEAPPIYRYAWTAVYPDATFFLELFHSKNINNYGGYANSEYDRLVEDLLKYPLHKRDAKFWTMLARAQDILLREDPALIPLYHYQKNSLISKRIKGLGVSPRGLDPLRMAFF